MAQIRLAANEAPTSAKASMAGFYKAAGDSMRLDILRVLRSDSFGVQELAFIFSMAQPAMSHHLKVLSHAGLVTSRRQGNSIFYRRSLVKGEGSLSRLKQVLFQETDTLEIETETQERIDKIYVERSKRSRSFFEKNAQQFVKNQGQLCNLSEYLGNMRELLDLANLPRTARVLEVGPGHGEFLRELSGRYANLVALDNSKEILEVARKQMAHTAEKIEFVCDSFEAFAPKNQTPFDAVLLNMVLHHIPSPPFVFEKAAALTSASGHILIADLAPHNQDWVRESCGDIWFGFDPEELDQWALTAGFREKQSLFLGLKNGFQVQLKLFQKF